MIENKTNLSCTIVNKELFTSDQQVAETIVTETEGAFGIIKILRGVSKNYFVYKKFKDPDEWFLIRNSLESLDDNNGKLLREIVKGFMIIMDDGYILNGSINGTTLISDWMFMLTNNLFHLDIKPSNIVNGNFIDVDNIIHQLAGNIRLCKSDSHYYENSGELWSRDWNALIKTFPKLNEVELIHYNNGQFDVTKNCHHNEKYKVRWASEMTKQEYNFKEGSLEFDSISKFVSTMNRMIDGKSIKYLLLRDKWNGIYGEIDNYQVEPELELLCKPIKVKAPYNYQYIKAIVNDGGQFSVEFYKPNGTMIYKCDDYKRLYIISEDNRQDLIRGNKIIETEIYDDIDY